MSEFDRPIELVEGALRRDEHGRLRGDIQQSGDLAVRADGLEGEVGVHGCDAAEGAQRLVERCRREIDVQERLYEREGKTTPIDGNGHAIEEADALELEELGTWRDRELVGLVQRRGAYGPRDDVCTWHQPAYAAHRAEAHEPPRRLAYGSGGNEPAPPV